MATITIHDAPDSLRRRWEDFNERDIMLVTGEYFRSLEAQVARIAVLEATGVELTRLGADARTHLDAADARVAALERALAAAGEWIERAKAEREQQAERGRRLEQTSNEWRRLSEQYAGEIIALEARIAALENER